jgi:hypothetical protein
MSDLLPSWQKLVPVEDPNMDLHDLQGAVGLGRYMDTIDDGEEEDVECCEDLQKCLVTAAVCEAEKVELEQENADLREELDILGVISPASYFDTTSCTAVSGNCEGVTSTISIYGSWVSGVSSSKWLIQSIDTRDGPVGCQNGQGSFSIVRVSTGGSQSLSASRNTREQDTINLIVGETYEVYSKFINFSGQPECSSTNLLGSFTVTSKGPSPI